ncbi:hypothetical protein ONZ43_g1129 [Nemania bipapillata]|uniref:Uncharacterized protein n=1 Tax=Nemania bipapillata TaxID=110536 RepID=A0ACC2J5L5_9PEZI|nr:hypothetical protein ONZ43_g1129 [Nemania bipapillata]
MECPATPKKQVRYVHPDQQPTPPATEKETAGVVGSDIYETPMPIRLRKPTAAVDRAFEDNHWIQEQALDSQRAQNEEDRQQEQGNLNYEEAITPKIEMPTQKLDADDLPESEVQTWIYNATSSEQRRRRFDAMLNAIFPSNDEFNAARYPFYDSEEDGLYSDFIKYETWDGHCPYDDDDYNPYKDPSRSTEIWKPKIGDEGIETEEDVRMVLKARREHKARSRRFKERKTLYIFDQLDAGVKYEDIDMLQIFTGPKLKSEETYEPSSDSEEENIKDPEVVVAAEATPIMAKEAPDTPQGAPLKPIIAANETRIFGNQTPENTPCPRRRGNGKKGRKSNKRKRDTTYKYDSGSEPEEPALKKKAKKGKRIINDADITDVQWRAQTRAAAQRKSLMGVDGTCDRSSEGSSEDSSDASSPSESSYAMDSFSRNGHVVTENGDNKPWYSRRRLSHLNSFIAG